MYGIVVVVDVLPHSFSPSLSEFFNTAANTDLHKYCAQIFHIEISKVIKLLLLPPHQSQKKSIFSLYRHSCRTFTDISVYLFFSRRNLHHLNIAQI